MIPEEEQSNYETFRDCLSDALIQSLAVEEPSKRKKKKSKERRNSKKSVDEVGKEEPTSDAEELGEFIEYLATEIFTSLPSDLRTLSYSSTQNSASLLTKYALPLSPSLIEDVNHTLPPSATDSLSTYLSQDPETANSSSILSQILNAYVASATAPPPIWSATRTSSCELCLRAHIPLTYHHLIPRGIHAKALKRGWCEEWEVNKVAWLCRACHSFVHRVASHEELAREFDSVEKLAEREDVRRFVGWVGRVRWRSR